jgi:hypothetical protein
VAHCIGAAMFSMAALSGSVKPEWVRAAVLSQVGPLLELRPTNRFRGYIASYFKYYLDIDEFDNVSTLSPFSRFLDRLLVGVLPYPWYEWGAHHSDDEPVTHGRTAALQRLGDSSMKPQRGDAGAPAIGSHPFKTYQQTIFYATIRRLTDESGQPRDHANIKSNLCFPICFLHGRKTKCSMSTSEVVDLRSVFCRGT